MKKVVITILSIFLLTVFFNCEQTYYKVIRKKLKIMIVMMVMRMMEMHIIRK